MGLIGLIKDCIKRHKKKKWRQKFDKIIDCQDDFELVNQLYLLLNDIWYYCRVDMGSEPEPSRTVTMVCESHGRIANGHFQFLFEGTFYGDPDFKLTAESYRNIDAIEAYNAFLRVFSYYPNNTVPDELEDREMVFSKIPEEVKDELFQPFAEIGDGIIIRNTAKFIREHKEELRDLIVKL